ncbi:MAG: glutamyl-tRNA amidotransferase [Candidatus Muproteobacteria bacterium RBG_16_60_9]|uniref:Glutamyl-tRNA amidotransferase n=1 Tax=Candidatus Muproteobacteria bacterium RBG_16_60_9 TaxID=1817755 RepID=A0A1F6V1R8_9PROT|nr:MAG: glutamyl-tRNA amidotransferase [Candidatus Muproteobacteria bacterium RBG_16_60_9]
MSLKEKILDDVKQAMRAKNQARVDTLRLLTAAIKQREVDERITLDDTQILVAIDKLVKRSRESIEQFEKGARPDLAAKEQADIAIWQVYLPQPLSAAEIDQLIAQAVTATGAASIKDMGKVMGVLKPQLQGRADIGQVSARIKARLGG